MRGHRDKSALLPEAEAEELDHARHIPEHAQAGGGEVGRKARGYMVEARLVEHTHFHVRKQTPICTLRR